MNCDRPDIAEKLVPYVEGALGEPDRTEVAGHLRRCAPCQDEARQVKESILTLKAAVRTGVWKEVREHLPGDWLALHFEDERAREAGFLPGSGLTDEQARQVRVHLAECLDCREELAMLRELDAEPLEETAQAPQPLARALRLEIERLYPSPSLTHRPASERTLGLADRLMAWINPKSLVMASLCIVALTFSYSLTRGGSSPELAKNPAASSSEVAMLDQEADRAAPPSRNSTPVQSQKKDEGALEKQAPRRIDEPKKEKDEVAREKLATSREDKPRPTPSSPLRDEKLAQVEPEERRTARELPSAERARPSAKTAQPVRTASTATAPRPAAAATAVKPAVQKPIAQGVATPVTVKPAATTSAGEPQTPPAPPPMMAMEASSTATGTKDEGVATAEPEVVAAGPATGPVPNAVTDLREEAIPVATQSEGAGSAALPPAAGAPASGGRVSVPASAPAATRSNSVPASSRVTGVVKPPAPASIPVRSLPEDKAAGYSVASTAQPTQSIQKTPADVARKQSMSRSVDGLAGEQVALSRQAALGAKARSVARQVSANASVLVEERPDGSVTVTVRPDRPLNADEKDRLRRLLRSELNLGEADTISIRQ